MCFNSIGICEILWRVTEFVSLTSFCLPFRRVFVAISVFYSAVDISRTPKKRNGMSVPIVQLVANGPDIELEERKKRKKKKRSNGKHRRIRIAAFHNCRRGASSPPFSPFVSPLSFGLFLFAREMFGLRILLFRLLSRYCYCCIIDSRWWEMDLYTLVV